MTKADQAKRYSALAKGLSYTDDTGNTVTLTVDEAEEIATALRRLAEIDSLEPVAVVHVREEGYVATLHTELLPEDDFDVPLYRLPEHKEPQT